MVAACAVGPLIIGDKEKPEKTNMINDTHVVDLAALGAGPAGQDVAIETKVPSPIKKKHAVGAGTRLHGGCPATVGHLYAFGSTEEEYSLLVLGCKGRGGQAGDTPFDHATGKGWVRERRGQYYDALFNKRNLVVAFVIEGGAGAGGGITPRARAYMRHVARTATCAGATDRTAYGVARGSTRDFLTHHTRRIVKAAVIGGAYSICEQITNLKQRACALAAAEA